MTTNLTTDRRPVAGPEPPTERQSGVEVIAARILTVAVVALVVIGFAARQPIANPAAMVTPDRNSVNSTPSASASHCAHTSRN